MEHGSRLFQSASKRSWNIQKYLVVPLAFLKKDSLSFPPSDEEMCSLLLNSTNKLNAKTRTHFSPSPFGL
ncbi:unnamed protein product [Meloidogyne enterolobii]|uniref:Uncharacterized protein n=1 Tax=Meloidogyne enterolobii TaxID=390850 RepID=A0ACB0Z115_MELEN